MKRFFEKFLTNIWSTRRIEAKQADFGCRNGSVIWAIYVPQKWHARLAFGWNVKSSRKPLCDKDLEPFGDPAKVVQKSHRYLSAKDLHAHAEMVTSRHFVAEKEKTENPYGSTGCKIQFARFWAHFQGGRIPNPPCPKNDDFCPSPAPLFRPLRGLLRGHFADSSDPPKVAGTAPFRLYQMGCVPEA